MFSGVPSPLNRMFAGNHWKLWFSDGFWVRQPLVTMVFDGCPPLVRGWNGQVPSNKSIVGQIKSVGLWSMWVGSYGYGHWSDHIGDYCSSNVKVDPKLAQKSIFPKHQVILTSCESQLLEKLDECLCSFPWPLHSRQRGRARWIISNCLAAM